MASSFATRLNDVKTNPILMMDVALSELEQQLDSDDDTSYDVPNASSPFIMLLEMGVISSVNTINEGESLLRRLYPQMAITPAELYLHMSDADYIGRFAIPAETTFEVLMLKGELYQKAIPVPNSNTRKLVIPRLTEFTVANTTFTMQYPIELRVMSHGGLQVVYDTSATSPVQVLESNMVDWDIRNINRQEIVHLKIPVKQFKVTTHIEALNAASAFDMDYQFDDLFYCARVFHNGGGESWQEIYTTHTDQVYDVAQPTAVLQVVDNVLNVKIPIIYFTRGVVSGELRVDIYSTKGRIQLDLGSYSAADFSMNLVTTDDDVTYVSPLNTFSQRAALNPNMVDGGNTERSFSDLRDQVIDNTLGSSRVPITHAQLGTTLDNLGYTVVTNIDNVTNRQFLASRRLPQSTSSAVTAPMGSLMGQIQAKMEDLVRSNHVWDNGDRITLKPSMLYEYNSGVVSVVSDLVIQSLLAQTPDAIAREVNGKQYLYSPLHYVWDATESQFDCRPYYMDQPSISSKVFVADNDTSELEVSIDTYDIARTDNGYAITLKLKSGEAFKAFEDDQVVVQLGYKPVDENRYASINGELVSIDPDDDERIYRFQIETTFDIDSRHNLYTTNLTMYDLSSFHFATSLELDFDVSFIIQGAQSDFYESSDLDLLVETHLLEGSFMVIARERLHTTLGYSLDALWRRNRSLISEESYEHYAADVPYVYEQTIYAQDEDGNTILTLDDNGDIQYTIEHNKGDPVLDDEGNPRLRFYQGDVKLGEDGKPVLKQARKILREANLFMVDGIYYFVTESEALDYRDEAPMQLTRWLINDIDALQARLLEQSEIYLYPTATLGDTMAVVKEGQTTAVALNQSLSVVYYMGDSAYRNNSLKDALTDSTRQIVNDLLGRTTVSISAMVSRLRENAGEDVISLEVFGLGDDANYNVISMTDGAVRMSLGKRLAVLPNQLLAAQDDIDISFKQHYASPS